eukprot:TRINITY_DN10656_c0_g1_i1.p1 TRINITY_DN10656_c0_g1~~TRINITY_DN10656_c0_g1_i1.p1  ORF type:complete len:140 (-),score=24.50 TRINITY_DN10656_c0_g1_i1:145-564(-)
MKPAWDQLGAEYAASSSVLVADVDCTVEDALCGEYGVNGYPTIKYFTPETDKKGDSYNGGRDFESLNTFVKDKLEVKCNVETPAECTEKEQDYITKMKGKSTDERKKQLERLSGMLGGSMTATAKAWVAQRVNILKQLD